MEKFKENERELKGKSYGKDSRRQELDPEQKEQEDLKEWLSDCVVTLNAQIESYENKLEDLNANKKKKIDKDVCLNTSY
jgi:CCR4-NOT transcription complex subunit 3